MLRNWSGVGGGGMITFLALAHMFDATQLVWGGWGGDDNIPCTCTHVGCYATGLGWLGGDDNIPCTCTHVGCYATGLGGGGDDNIPCTCTHVGRYATGLGWVGGG